MLQLPLNPGNLSRRIWPQPLMLMLEAAEYALQDLRPTMAKNCFVMVTSPVAASH
jgi:hypothetical protein